MLNVDLDQEQQALCPVYAGSAIDRLANWCRDDCLQQEQAVIEALARCREILHNMPRSAEPQTMTPFPVGAVATLICEVQSRLNGTGRCTS
jgi:hypothetical protein